MLLRSSNLEYTEMGNLTPQYGGWVRSITHSLAKQHFYSYEETKNLVYSWVASKDEQFSRRRIHMLAETWEEVVTTDRQYFQN